MLLAWMHLEDEGIVDGDECCDLDASHSREPGYPGY
jgi:hypothetical protein